VASQIFTTLLITAFAALLHYLVWRHLVVATAIPSRFRPWIAGYLVTSTICLPVTIWSARLGASFISRRLAWFAMPSVAWIGMTGLALLVVNAPRWIAKAARRLQQEPRTIENPQRRLLLSRATSGAAAAVGTLAVTKGIANAQADHIIERSSFTIPGLPKELDGFRIVQLSDLHVGLTIDRDFVERVVAKANALAPDLFVLTGDLVDGHVDELRNDVAPLATLSARYGIYAITGNHEYYSGADAWVAHFESLGIRYLRNQRVAIGSDSASFDLAGVEDHSADHYDGHTADLPAALAGRDKNRALVLLAHQPRQARAAAVAGVPLVLSGHTHGGQIWPWHLVVYVQQRGLVTGHYQLGETSLYVNRGCGYVGPPMRLFAPLEIAEITLRCP
jgi:uncharacterized protein